MTEGLTAAKRTWSANNEPLNETDARLAEFDQRLRVLEDILFKGVQAAEAKRRAAKRTETPEPPPADPELLGDLNER